MKYVFILNLKIFMEMDFNFILNQKIQLENFMNILIQEVIVELMIGKEYVT